MVPVKRVCEAGSRLSPCCVELFFFSLPSYAASSSLGAAVFPVSSWASFQ